LSLFTKLGRLISEPPPERFFELSETAVAIASWQDPAERKLERLDEKSLNPSPSAPNVLRPQSYRDLVSRSAPLAGTRRNTAALVIPDYAARMTILDFQEFPAGEEERTALLRFRLRKSVPFHVEEAKLAYSIQVQESKRVEVLAVAIALPILTEYESVLTDAGYRVGLVMPSSVAALPLFASAEPGLTLVAKTAGTTLSVLLLQAGRVRLARCLDLAAGEESTDYPDDSVLGLIQQTVAFAEDQIGSKVARLLLCGFGARTERIGALATAEFDIPYEKVRSKFGDAVQENAGVLGLLEQYAA
jgi:type IV pilus assembly protein PilM